MAKLSTISLEELYSRKITKSVEEAIMEKEDFSSISENWCDKVCTLACKSPSDRLLHSEPVDVLIIQDHRSLDDIKFGRPGEVIERKMLEIIQYLAKKSFQNHLDTTYHVTSLLKCHIEREDTVRGKAPRESVLMKCRPYVLDEIDRIRPKVIVSLSTAVTKSLGLKKANYGNRGEIVEYKGIPVVITLHPRILVMLRQNSSGKMWGPDFTSTILGDFNKVTGLLNGELKVPNLEEGLAQVKPRIRVARNIEEVKAFTEFLSTLGLSKGVLSYDTETTGLDPLAPDAKLLTVQFGYKSRETGLYNSIVFPMWHRENKGYSAEEAWGFIKPLLENPEILKIGHNMKFDVLYTWHTTGVRIKGILFDTMLLLHSINSGVQGTYGLKQAVHDWLPDTQLGNYEDKLPKLSKLKEEEEEEVEE